MRRPRFDILSELYIKISLIPEFIHFYFILGTVEPRLSEHLAQENLRMKIIVEVS